MQFIQTITLLACAMVASAGHCTTAQLSAVDGRSIRFTGGGGTFQRGTEQDISFDIPAGTPLEGLANVYIRDVNGTAHNVIAKGITGGSFTANADSTASAEFIIPAVQTGSVPAVPKGVYSYWANLRLKSGETCAFGSTNTFQLK